ncbi:MAG: GTP-binding protein [Deltaproteobacteria bacterium]|nr:GTP-binding protein [Deltaproteobacteria bacterium]
MDKKALRLVIVGHVDHGKSTLIGRLLYDTESLPEDRLKEIEKTSATLGRETEFAFVMDSLEEERKRGITIDTTQTFFKTPKRRYVIIDAPGHKEFLKNMITGTSQAEAALLIVDAQEGVREQTKRHGYILGMLGLRQVIIVINKMDLVNYSEERFQEVKEEIAAFLNSLYISPPYTIPISAIKGDNVAKASGHLPWYKGSTMLEALDTFSELKIEEKPFRFPVQDIYQVEGKRMIVGRVEAGSVQRGDTLYLLPLKKEVKVENIEKFLAEGVDEAGLGESIGICLGGDPEVERGQILSRDLSPIITDRIKANMFWMERGGYKVGDPLLFRCVTQEIPCTIENIYKKFDPASMEVIQEDAHRIREAEVAKVMISLSKEAVIDPFQEIPEMGRFVLEQKGIPVAGGIIL